MKTAEVVSKGIRFSKKLKLWVVYKNYNKVNEPDFIKYFINKEEAEVEFKKL